MTGKQLKNSILQWAIQGKLVPQDPNDEPASVLLEKIRAEKARLYNEGVLKKNDLKEREIHDEEVPFLIPQSWVWTKIDNIAFVTKLAGFEYSEYVSTNFVSKESGVPLFKGKNVQNGKIVYEFESYIPLSVSNELRRSQINKKCLLTPYVGTIGNIGIHDREGIFHLGSNVGKIEFYNGNETNVIEEYAKYYLMSNYGYQELTKYKKATAQESISIEAIRDVFIPLPPIKEQRRIVAKLATVFALVDKYGAAQETLEELNISLPEKLKKSILQEAIQGKLVPQDPADEPVEITLKKYAYVLPKKASKAKEFSQELFDIPDSWTWAPFKKCAEVLYGYPFDSQKFSEVIMGMPMIRIRDVLPGITKTYTTEKADERYIIRKGDMLVGMDGNFNVNYWNSTDAYLNQRVCKIVANEHVVLQKYLYYYLPIVFEEISSNVSYCTVKHLADTHFNLMRIPLPPLAEQHRIVAKIEELIHEIDKLKA